MWDIWRKQNASVRPDLQHADLRRERMYHWLNLEGADLAGANLEGVTLLDAELQGANLEQANLTASNLENANLKRKRVDLCG